MVQATPLGNVHDACAGRKCRHPALTPAPAAHPPQFRAAAGQKGVWGRRSPLPPPRRRPPAAGPPSCVLVQVPGEAKAAVCLLADVSFGVCRAAMSRCRTTIMRQRQGSPFQGHQKTLLPKDTGTQQAFALITTLQHSCLCSRKGLINGCHQRVLRWWVRGRRASAHAQQYGFVACVPPAACCVHGSSPANNVALPHHTRKRVRPPIAWSAPR